MTQKQIKKKLKEIVSDTYSWVDSPKGSDDFNIDLDIDYDELGDLKEPIIEEFGVAIKKREIRFCDDINELSFVIYEKMTPEPVKLPTPTINSNASGNLSSDLENMADELYTQEDLRGGLKIIRQMIKEVGGAVGLFIVVGKVLTLVSAGLLAPIGIPIAGSQIARVQVMAVKAYAESNAADRKKIRAAVSFIKGGFSLGNRLIR